MNAKVIEHPTLSKKRQCLSLANAIETTEEMLLRARTGEWESVRELEQKRRGYLDECLAMPIEEKDTRLFSDALSTLLGLNETLIACVYETRKQVEKEQLNARQAASMVNKYLDL